MWAALAAFLGELLLAAAFVSFTLVILVTRIRATGQTQDYGATTVIAGMLTFALGAIAVQGEIAIAAAGGVITATLLGIKPQLHKLMSRISQEELFSVLKLLVMSVVLLPVLPNRGYGPWEVFNPYELWLMVVLIAGVSFLGYAAVRLGR